MTATMHFHAENANETARNAFDRGREAEREGDRLEAIERFREAHEADPDNPEICFKLAYHLDLLGEEDEAVSLYERAVSGENPPINALLNLAILYEDRGEYDRAEHCVQQVLATNPNHARARLFQKDMAAGSAVVLDDERERELEKWQALLDTPVTDFNLQVKTRNALRRIGIRTLSDLLRTTEAELQNYKVDEDSLDEVKRMLAQRSLRLGQTLPGQEEATPSATESDQGILGRSVNELDLPVRARKALALLGIQTVGDLCERTEQELMGIKNFGQTSLDEIKRKLAEHGLSLRQVEG